MCSGRYAGAADMLNAAYGKYGTLYAGGDHFHIRDNVGATLDLWRLWNGLPDLKLREPGRFTPGWQNDPLLPGGTFSAQMRDDQINRAVQIVNTPTPPDLSDLQRYTISAVLDLATVAGQDPGWWHDPGAIATMPEGAQRSARRATTEPLITWLYLLQDASMAPWEPVWHRATPQDAAPAMQDDAAAFAAPQSPANPAAFAAATAALTAYSPDAAPLPLTRPVHACTATPAEYALWSVEVLEGLRASHGGRFADLITYLPTKMRAIAATQMALSAVYGADHRTLAQRRAVLDWAASFVPEPEVRAWLDTGRIYLAGSVSDLIRVTADAPLDARTLRALNVLSASDLRQFVEAQTRPSAQMQPLLSALAAREFVLGDLTAARHHLTLLATAPNPPLPEVTAALSSRGPEEVRVARALLALDAPSVWLRTAPTYHLWDANIAVRNAGTHLADLPVEFQYAGFLDRDLNAWLLQDHDAYRGMHGYTIAALDRMKSRGQLSRPGASWPQTALTFRPSSPTAEMAFPFATLIAAAELDGLGPCDGLTKKLSSVLLDWADQGSTSWLGRHLLDHTAYAETLRRIILLNKRNPGVLVDGKPAGQRAYALLTTRFPATQAARSTKYWFYTAQGCQHQEAAPFSLPPTPATPPRSPQPRATWPHRPAPWQ